MKQGFNSERKRICAMLLACMLIVNLVAGNGSSIVYADGLYAEKVNEIASPDSVSGEVGSIEGDDVSSNEHLINTQGTGMFSYKPQFEVVLGNYISTDDQQCSFVSGSIYSIYTLSQLRWSTTSLDNTNYTSGNSITTTSNGTNSYYFTISSNTVYSKIYLYAENEQGYSTYEVTLSEDKDHPRINFVEIHGDNYVERMDGYFFEDSISFYVDGTDIGSGIGKYSIWVKDAGGNFSEIASSTHNIVTITELTELTPLFITAEDQLGNTSDMRGINIVGNTNGGYVLPDKANEFMIDKEAPTIEINATNSSDKKLIAPQNEGDVIWVTGDYRDVEITVADTDSGVANMKWGVGDVSENMVLSHDVRGERLKTWTTTIEGKLKKGKNKVWASVKDIVKRSTEKSVTIGVDVDAPEIDSCNISLSDNSKTLNFFTWGTYANGKVNLTIKASDIGSGVHYVNVHVGDTTISGSDLNEQGSITISLDKDLFAGENCTLQDVQISAVDRCGQASVREYINDISREDKILNEALLIEDIIPQAELIVDNDYVYSNQNCSIVGKEFVMDISAGDAESGIHLLEVIQKNESGQKITSYDFEIKGGRRGALTKTVKVDTGDGANYPNGIVKMQVIVTDYAGNTYSSDDYTYYIDLVAPTIKKYELFTEDDKASKIAEIIDSGDYGYYFPKDAIVRIWATDGATDSSSGVKKIEYYTVNEKGEQSEIATVSGKSVYKKETEGEDTLYYTDIRIGDGFKGHIYALACDYVGNRADSYVSTKGAIVETQSRHDEEKHIEVKLPGSSHTDSNGNRLYSNDVTIPVTITDTVSGIAEISWSVEGAFDADNNHSGTITVGDNKAGTKEIDGWNILEFDRNLVVKMQGKIQVKNNSNDIVLKIAMKDNAGNETTYTETISIDKTDPLIEISFDNNDPDDVYSNIYSQNRTASIVIKERNFSASDIEIEIANTLGSIPDISGWTSNINKKNPDSSTHTAKVTFSQDGDYTMNVSGQDAAGNNADSKSVDLFIIDKTLPEIVVTYSNNDVKNGNYYSDERTVYISVTDRNFAPERVSLVGTMVEPDGSHAFPVMSSFTKRGNVYTATAVCQKDAMYSFTVECSDKAGNQGETFTSGTYYIDQTSPIIEFTGVEPNSANNGDLMPQVVMTDNNYTGHGVNIRLIGANNGLMDLPGVFGTLTRGESYTFQNFPKKSKYDDLYTIEVDVIDLAGNVTTNSITFSVNRFGSVYVFNDALKNIAGTYVSEPIDINLTEVNIDTLEHETIKVVMDYNGTSRDLTEDDDYKVQMVRGEGSWFRYNYNIDQSLFEGDGRYIVTLYSVDRAGNVNQNTDESKKAEISFGVDKTAPVVVPINLENNKQYAVDVKTATVAVNDNLVLKDVAIYLNGKTCEYTTNDENYIFDIPSSQEKQQITILATDMAGNMMEYVVRDVLVNTNLFVRWYNNKPLFIGSILTVFVLCGGGLLMGTVYKKRQFKKRK